MKKCDFEDFQALLEKTKNPMKTISGQEMLKIIQKNNVLYSEVGKTTSRWIFWRKSKNQNFAFLKKKHFNVFQERMCKRLKKTLFLKICEVEVFSFHTQFQVSKNI